jgi:methyl-accepting chemotaxis protein
MFQIRKLGLRPKLVICFLMVGLIPVMVCSWRFLRASQRLGEGREANMALLAGHIMDKIERNLFERYGDVQAFGVNTAVLKKEDWYQVGSDKNGIALTANKYAGLYGFYPLLLMVDLEGKVVAVNDRDASGKTIDTTSIYQQNFKESPWFKETMAGNFNKSKTLDGTFMEDVQVDPNVKRLYGGDGLILGFSAPVKDADGKGIGVWQNCADFSLVVEFCLTCFEDMRAKSMGTTE